jgi:hypothetical protein
MSPFRSSSRESVLTRLAPISEKAGTDRRMRSAVLRAKRKGPAAVQFGQQQSFDRAVAELVREIPVSAEISEWFRNEKLIPQKKSGWQKAIRNPVVISIALALAVIAGVLVFVVVERMNEFPGSGTARKMLTIASSMRGVQIDKVEAEAGSLSDFFFMKYRLEHYDVPPEFAGLRASACRVFDDDEGHRVAQISFPVGATWSTRAGSAPCTCAMGCASWRRCAGSARISRPIWRSIRPSPPRKAPRVDTAMGGVQFCGPRQGSSAPKMFGVDGRAAPKAFGVGREFNLVGKFGDARVAQW